MKLDSSDCRMIVLQSMANNYEQVSGSSKQLRRSSRLNKSTTRLEQTSHELQQLRHKWQSIGAIDNQTRQKSNFERLRKGYASMRKSFRLQVGFGSDRKQQGHKFSWNESENVEDYYCNLYTQIAEDQQKKTVINQLGSGAARLIRTAAFTYGARSATMQRRRRQQQTGASDEFQDEIDGSFKAIDAPSSTANTTNLNERDNLTGNVAATALRNASNLSESEKEIVARLRRSKRRQLAGSASFGGRRLMVDAELAYQDVDLEQVEAIKRDNLRLTLRSQASSPRVGDNNKAPKLFSNECSCKSLRGQSPTAEHDAGRLAISGNSYQQVAQASGAKAGALVCSCESVSSYSSLELADFSFALHSDAQSTGGQLQSRASGGLQLASDACHGDLANKKATDKSSFASAAEGARKIAITTLELEKLCGHLARQRFSSRWEQQSELRSRAVDPFSWTTNTGDTNKSSCTSSAQLVESRASYERQEFSFELGGVKVASLQVAAVKADQEQGQFKLSRQEMDCARDKHYQQAHLQQKQHENDLQQTRPARAPSSLEPDANDLAHSSLQNAENCMFVGNSSEQNDDECGSKTSGAHQQSLEDTREQARQRGRKREMILGGAQMLHLQAGLGIEPAANYGLNLASKQENLYACIYDDSPQMASSNQNHHLHQQVHAATTEQQQQKQQEQQRWQLNQQLVFEANERRLYEEQLAQHMRAQKVRNRCKSQESRSGKKSIFGRLKRLITATNSQQVTDEQVACQNTFAAADVGWQRELLENVAANRTFNQSTNDLITLQQQSEKQIAHANKREDFHKMAATAKQKVAGDRLLASCKSTQNLLNTSMRYLSPSRKSVNLTLDNNRERCRVREQDNSDNEVFELSSSKKQRFVSSKSFMSGFLTLGRRSGAATLANVANDGASTTLAPCCRATLASDKRQKESRNKREYVGHLFEEAKQQVEDLARSDNARLKLRYASVDSLPSADSGLSCGGNVHSSISDNDNNFYLSCAGPGCGLQTVPGEENFYSIQQVATDNQQRRASTRHFVGLARAKVDCNPCAYDHEALVFKRGDLIHIIERNQTGTWLGQCGQQVGHFKFINVEELTPPASPATDDRQRPDTGQVSGKCDKALAGNFVTKLEIKSPVDQVQNQQSVERRKKSISLSEIVKANEAVDEPQRQVDKSGGVLGQRQDRTIMNSLEQLLFAIGLADESVSNVELEQSNNDASNAVASDQIELKQMSYLSVLKSGGINDLDSFSWLECNAELQRIGITNDEHQRRLLVAARIIRQALKAAKWDFLAAESQDYRQHKSSIPMNNEQLKGVPGAATVSTNGGRAQSDERRSALLKAPSKQVPPPPPRPSAIAHAKPNGNISVGSEFQSISTKACDAAVTIELNTNNNQNNQATSEPIYVNLPSSKSIRSTMAAQAYVDLPSTSCATSRRSAVVASNKNSGRTSNRAETNFTRGCSLRVSKRNLSGSGIGALQKPINLIQLPSDLNNKQRISPVASHTNVKGENVAAKQDHSLRCNNSQLNKSAIGNNKLQLNSAGKCNESSSGQSQCLQASESRYSLKAFEGDYYYEQAIAATAAAYDDDDDDYDDDYIGCHGDYDNCDPYNRSGGQRHSNGQRCSRSIAVGEYQTCLNSKSHIINSKSAYDLRLNLSHFFS